MCNKPWMAERSFDNFAGHEVQFKMLEIRFCYQGLLSEITFLSKSIIENNYRSVINQNVILTLTHGTGICSLPEASTCDTNILVQPSRHAMFRSNFEKGLGLLIGLCY